MGACGRAHRGSSSTRVCVSGGGGAQGCAGALHRTGLPQSPRGKRGEGGWEGQRAAACRTHGVHRQGKHIGSTLGNAGHTPHAQLGTQGARMGGGGTHPRLGGQLACHVLKCEVLHGVGAGPQPFHAQGSDSGAEAIILRQETAAVGWWAHTLGQGPELMRARSVELEWDSWRQRVGRRGWTMAAGGGGAMGIGQQAAVCCAALRWAHPPVAGVHRGHAVLLDHLQCSAWVRETGGTQQMRWAATTQKGVAINF